MPLTDPGTRSPGRLVIGYQTLGIEHLAGAWLVAGVDPDASLSSLRTEATEFATVLMGSCANTSYAHSWYIMDADGVTMFAENFPAPIPGTHSADGALTSQSIEITYSGKGTPSTLAVKSGRTRTSVFTGLLAPTYELTKDFAIFPGGPEDDGVTFLRESELIGADKYGQKATYSSRMLVQINAHYQKDYGV